MKVLPIALKAISEKEFQKVPLLKRIQFVFGLVFPGKTNIADTHIFVTSMAKKMILDTGHEEFGFQALYWKRFRIVDTSHSKPLNLSFPLDRFYFEVSHFSKKADALSLLGVFAGFTLFQNYQRPDLFLFASTQDKNNVVMSFHQLIFNKDGKCVDTMDVEHAVVLQYAPKPNLVPKVMGDKW